MLGRMGYTPLDADLLTSTVLQHGPDVVSIWALILASSDKLGQSSLQPSVAASLLGITFDRAVAAYEVLQAPDPWSRNKEYGGRRLQLLDNGYWKIISHQKYQRKASRAAATERQRRYDQQKREREDVDAMDKCEIRGCKKPVVGMVGGIGVCEQHSFEGGIVIRNSKETE